MNRQYSNNGIEWGVGELKFSGNITCYTMSMLIIFRPTMTMKMMRKK